METADASPVSFLVIADWGVNCPATAKLAQTMAAVQPAPSMVMALGDKYVGPLRLFRCFCYENAHSYLNNSLRSRPVFITMAW